MSRIDRALCEACIDAHLRALGLPPQHIRWARDLETAARSIHADAQEVVDVALAIDALEREFLGETDTRGSRVRVAAHATRRIARCTIYEAATTFVVDTAVGALEQRDPDGSMDLAFEVRSPDEMIVAASLERVDPLADIAGRDAIAETLLLASVLAARADCIVRTRVRHRAIEHALRVFQPLIVAKESGLFGFWVTANGVLAVPRPEVHTERGKLHRDGGPAIAWPGGEQHHYWRGVRVPEHVAMRPDSISLSEIFASTNAELRRVLIERYGPGRYLIDAGAEVIDVDPRWGALYRRPIPNDEDLVMVNVRNSTPEPDGSFKSYWLRVPPDVSRAREAIAWTFGLDACEYTPEHET